MTWCIGHLLGRRNSDAMTPPQAVADGAPSHRAASGSWWPSSSTKSQLAASSGSSQTAPTCVVNAGDPDERRQLLVDR